MSDSRLILVVFSDSSLGGTSRSACLAGVAWKSRGYKVVFCSLSPIHPGRLASFDSVGSVISSLSVVNWSEVSAVHYHHGAWASGQVHAANNLIASVRGIERVPPLITNNIFAVEDSILAKWPGQRVTGVLGVWAAEQFRANSGHRSNVPFIIPNPQDSDFFHAPTGMEREDARALLGIDGPCLLRIGSPHYSKWSPDYVALIDAANAAGIQTILVGVPDRLRLELDGRPNLRIIDAINDDVQLRNLYWASDVFTVDALRGESFGNVIFESLLCGTPVVYRARVFRDNTPWELRRTNGFYYERRIRSWIGSSLYLSIKNRGRGLVRVDADAVAESYSIAAVAEKLNEIICIMQASSSRHKVVSENRQRFLNPSFLDKIRIRVRHNPLVSKIKQRALARTEGQ